MLLWVFCLGELSDTEAFQTGACVDCVGGDFVGVLRSVAKLQFFRAYRADDV